MRTENHDLLQFEKWNREISMTKKEALEELEKAHVLILTSVERFNEAVRMAHDALKQQTEGEEREAKQIEGDSDVYDNDK